MMQENTLKTQETKHFIDWNDIFVGQSDLVHSMQSGMPYSQPLLPSACSLYWPPHGKAGSYHTPTTPVLVFVLTFPSVWGSLNLQNVAEHSAFLTDGGEGRA